MLFKLARLSQNNKLEVDGQINKFVNEIKYYSPIVFDEKKLRTELLLVHKCLITIMKDMKKCYSSDIDINMDKYLKDHCRAICELFDYKLEIRARYTTVQESYINSFSDPSKPNFI